MVNTSSHRDSCVFSQLVCALVGLGYQVQVFFLDAWSFGSAQSRSRVFLAFTAPGLRTPKAPKPSHSHPENTPLQKLGEMSCGRPFDSRKIVPTPFKFVSLKEAVGDLPDVQDGKADFCVGYPDHRLSIGYTPKIRKQLQCGTYRKPFVNPDLRRNIYCHPKLINVTVCELLVLKPGHCNLCIFGKYTTKKRTNMLLFGRYRHTPTG